MKKLLVSVLAIAGLVACTQETTLVQKGNAPMEFGGAFVEKATRSEDPSTTTEKLNGFDVWGFMDSPEGLVFEGEDVTKNGDKFAYTNVQYWIPGHDYYFAALAPMNSANWDLNTADANEYGAGVVSFKNVNGTEDLLYAAKMVSTKGLEVGETPGVVELQFNHLLSKVKFSFTNGFTNDNAYITVKNIRMEVPAEGTINLAQPDWWSTNKWDLGEGKLVLDFGNMESEKVVYNSKTECQYERLTIPADAAQVYNVTFDVTLYMGDVVALESTLSTKIEGAELKIGKAYNFHATIDASNVLGEEGKELQPIEFDVEEVKGWENGNGYDGGVIETGLYEKQLRDALAQGLTVELSQDVVITEPLVVAAGTSSVINLNGYDIINETKTLDFGKGEGIVVYGDLTINGEGLVKGSTRAVWARGDKGATVTINGGTYEGCEEGYAEGGNSVIYASSGNVVNIYGGTVKALAADKTSYANKTEGVYAALNVADNNGMINVYGGSFYKQNPAAPGTEPAAWNAAHANGFVAEGCASVAEGDYFVVRPVVASKTDIQALLAKGVTEFDANGAEIGDLNAAFTMANVPAGVTVTVKNAKVAGRSYGNKLNGNVVFEDCEFKNMGGAYSIHFDGGNGNVTFKNCTLYGWNSFGKIGSVTMEGCKLFGNGLYSMIRSYTLLNVTDCEFDFTDAIHTDEWPETVEAIEGGALVEENCKYIR